MDFELFNGTNLEEPDADHRIAMNKPSLAGAFYVRWDAFKNLLRGFLVSKDTDQSVSGNKTFTGVVNVQSPTSDNNPVTLKYFNDNAGGGGEEIIEVSTFVNLPLVGDANVLYVVLDENVLYRWSGTVYVSMSSPLSYASQAEMELSEPTENTKVVTPLRAWQGFVFWLKNTVFTELATTDKTAIGSINELAANTLKGSTTVHTTPIDADSLGILDSVANMFKRLPLLTLYNFFVAKSVPPEEASELLDTDVVFGGRGTDARYWAVSLWVQKLIGYLPKDAAYMAASWADVQAICESATCPASVQIHLTNDVTLGSLSTFAKNIVFSGRQCILPDASTPLFVGAGTTGSFRITFESGIGCAGGTGTLTFGSGTYVQNWDVRIRDIVGLAVTGTVLTVNKATGSIVSFKYNDAIDVAFSSASTSTRVQSDMWYTLTKTVVRNRQTGAANSSQSFFIGYLPVGWQLDSVRFKYVSGGGAAMTLQPAMQFSGSTYTPIATAINFGSGGYSSFGARDSTSGLLFYDSPAGMNAFSAIVINTTADGKTIAALATDSSNVVFDVIIEIHKV